MKVRDNRGSITIFVLVGLFFMSAFLLISYAYNVNKSKVAQEQFNIISKIYSPKQSDEESYTDAYTTLRKKNKTTLTESITYNKDKPEESKVLELTKSFEEDLKDFKIYGNSMQNGTPTPENPIEVKSVGEKTKNLLSISQRTLGELPDEGYIAVRSFEFDKYYVGLIADSGYYPDKIESYSIVNETVKLKNKDSGYGIGFPFEVKSNTEYTIKAENKLSFGIGFYKKDGEEYEYLKYHLGTSPFTFTTPENCEVITLVCRPSSVGVEETYSNIYFFEGSESIVDYEPYGKYRLSVKASKENLFESLTLEQGTIQDATGITSNNNKRVRTKLFSLGAGTYTIKLDWAVNKIYLRGIHIYNYETETWEKYIKSGSSNETFTLPKRSKVRLIFNTGDNDVITPEDLLEENPILQMGEKIEDDVITHIYLDEPLRKIGSSADYIDFASGKVIRNVKQTVLTGEESWVCNLTNNDIVERRYERLIMPLSDAIQKSDGFCNICLVDTDAWGLTTFVCQLDNARRIRFYRPFYTGIIETEETSTNELEKIWKSFLSDRYKVGNPVKVDYILETPTEEVVEIPSILKTFEDYTKIEVLTDIAPSKIEATYEGYTLE